MSLASSVRAHSTHSFPGYREPWDVRRKELRDVPGPSQQSGEMKFSEGNLFIYLFIEVVFYFAFDDGDGCGLHEDDG